MAVSRCPWGRSQRRSRDEPDLTSPRTIPGIRSARFRLSSTKTFATNPVRGNQVASNGISEMRTLEAVTITALCRPADRRHCGDALPGGTGLLRPSPVSVYLLQWLPRGEGGGWYYDKGRLDGMACIP